MVLFSPRRFSLEAALPVVRPVIRPLAILCRHPDKTSAFP